MITLTAKPGDDLNVVFNTQSSDTLCVLLPKDVVYRQKVKINRDNLIVIGSDGSLISYNDHNGQTAGFGTADSASLTISGSNIHFYNVGFENNFDYPYFKANRKKDDGMGLQAVAVYISQNSDFVFFNNCRFKSYQDTLFADGLGNNFIDCEIEGCVDFIFGSAQALFSKCRIVSNGEGYVAAPSTKEDYPFGFTFFNCDFTCQKQVKEGSVFLARPWHPGGRQGVNSAMSVRNCKLGEHINKDLWTIMKDSKGVVHTPQESRYDIQNN